MRRNFGFTLLELLIAIVVATILLAAGTPAFNDFVKNNRVTGQTNDLVSVIQLARSEALKRSTNVVVCASSDQASCTGKDTWTNGWIVFSDFDPTDGPDPDVGTGKCADDEDCIVTTRGVLSHGSTITTEAKSLCFLPTGLSGTAPSSSTEHCANVANEVNIIIKAGNCEKKQARKVVVTTRGHTLVSKCSSCVCS